MLLQGSFSKVVTDEQDRNFSECFCCKISEGIRVIKILKQLTIKKNPKSLQQMFLWSQTVMVCCK